MSKVSTELALIVVLNYNMQYPAELAKYSDFTKDNTSSTLKHSATKLNIHSHKTPLTVIIIN